MCIIIVKPKGKTIDKRLARHCWSRNSDGAGFAFSHNDKIRVHKELKDFEKFWSLYERFIIKPQMQCEEYQDLNGTHNKRSRELEKNILIHFRIGTSGLVSRENIHPFCISSKLAFAHNGIITGIDTTKDDQYSDTYLFNELVRSLPSGWTKNKSINTFIKNFIGINSKLAFINNKGNYSFVREAAGEWDEITGLWFSNTTFRGWTYNPDTNRGSFNNRRATKSWNEYNERQIPYVPATTSNEKEPLPIIPDNDNSNVFTMYNKKDFEDRNNSTLETCEDCSMFLFSETEVKAKKCEYCQTLINIKNNKEESGNRSHLH